MPPCPVSCLSPRSSFLKDAVQRRRCVITAMRAARVAAAAAAFFAVPLLPITLILDLIQFQLVLSNRTIVLLYQHMIGCRASEAESTASHEQEVDFEMAYPDIELYVDGQWRRASGTPIINPADESV